MFFYRSLKVQGLSSDMAWLFGICLLLLLHSQGMLALRSFSSHFCLVFTPST